MTDAASWPRPRALLLDAMGTLIRLRESVGRTYAHRAARHGLIVEPEAIDRAFPSVLRQAPPLAFRNLDDDALLKAERAWWAERIDAVLEAAGGEAAPEALHRELFDHYGQARAWTVYQDVPAHLRSWRASGLRLAVVSNFDRRLHALLEELGLAANLDRVVVSSSAGAAKPSPEPFRQALEALAVPAQDTWHVGDSPEDAEGARAAGVRCLIVRRS